MALFNEINSLLFPVLVRLHNEVCDGKKVTRQEMHKAIMQAFPIGTESWNSDNLLFTQQEENVLLDMLFAFESEAADAVAAARLNIKLPRVLFSELERRWLKTMLVDEQASFLVSEELKAKLLSELEGVAKLPLELWDKLQAVGDSNVAGSLQSHLKVIWQAIREKRKIFYRNVTASGELREDTAAPCRLEYDIAMNRYYLIAWNYPENRAVKILVSRLQTVSITDEEVTEDLLLKTFPDFLASKQCSVTLKLWPKNNAVDRCLSLFSSYDKAEAYMNNDGSCHLKILYYEFDSDEVKEKILSLGSAAVVTEPPEMREEIIRIFREAYEWYK